MGPERRVVLITGCSSGFGQAMVPAFLDHGWHVLATMRGAAARAATLRGEGEQHPGRLGVLALDVTREGERRAAVASARERWGRLDCVVSNAGQALRGALEDTAPDQLRTQLEVNCVGPALLLREALPLLRAVHGRIILISSLFGRVGFPLSSAYCASKFALEGLGAALREELRSHGVQVALVEPGRHRTGFASRATVATASGAGRSPYAAQSAAYERLAQSLAEAPGPAAAQLAEAVVALAERRHMPARLRLGRDAQAVHLMRRCLPERLADTLWGIVCARALRRRAERGTAAEVTV